MNYQLLYRDFIGIEIHEPYYWIAEQRMMNAREQISIFDMEEHHDTD